MHIVVYMKKTHFKLKRRNTFKISLSLSFPQSQFPLLFSLPLLGPTISQSLILLCTMSLQACASHYHLSPCCVPTPPPQPSSFASSINFHHPRRPVECLTVQPSVVFPLSMLPSAILPTTIMSSVSHSTVTL